MEFGTSPSVRLPPTLSLLSTILVQFVTQQVVEPSGLALGVDVVGELFGLADGLAVGY